MGKGVDERGYATDAGDLGRGIYYSTDEGTAKGYGEVSSQELTFKNPLAVSARDIANPEQTGLAQKYKTIVSMHPGVSAEEKKRLALEGSTKLTEDLLEQGYDALIVSGYDSPKGHYTVVDLKPSDQPQQAVTSPSERKHKQAFAVEKYAREYSEAFSSEEAVAAFRETLKDPSTKEYQQFSALMEHFVEPGWQAKHDEYNQAIERGEVLGNQWEDIDSLKSYRSPNALFSQIAGFAYKKFNRIKFSREKGYRDRDGNTGEHRIDGTVIEQVLHSLIGGRYPGNTRVDIPMRHIKSLKYIRLNGGSGLQTQGRYKGQVLAGVATYGKGKFGKAGNAAWDNWGYILYGPGTVEIFNVDHYFPSLVYRDVK